MKRCLFSLSFLLLLFGFSKSTFAQEVDLRNFIARPDFPEHYLSTGVNVYYTSDGVGDGTPVRQYKNQNYEQFFLKDDGIYRREDTSWAPFSGNQAQCDNGNKAIYTLDATSSCATPGQTPSTDGARWIQNIVTVGQTYSQQTNNILSVDSGQPYGSNGPYNISRKEDMTVCSLKPPQSGYPACNATPALTVTGYFEPGEYTFCTGATNPAPVVTLSGTAGAGTGDGFAYMENCGLVGFSDAGLKVGLVKECGVDVTTDQSGWTCSNEYRPPITADEFSCDVSDDIVERTILVKGRVTQATWTETPSMDDPAKMVMRTGLGFRNMVVTNYSGDPCTISKFGSKTNAGKLVNIDYAKSPHVSTSSDGSFEIPVHQTKYVKQRFIGFSCNGRMTDLYQCDLSKDRDGIIKLDVEANCQGTFTTVDRAGNSVRPFLELTPKSPGENVQITDLNKFTICVETIKSRPQVRDYVEQKFDDKTTVDGRPIARQLQSQVDVDQSYIDPLVSPDPNCVEPAPAPYERCMPPEALIPLDDEFSSFTTLTHVGKPQFDMMAYDANLACGPLFQQSGHLRMNDEQDKPAPTSKGKHPDILPTLEYLSALRGYTVGEKCDQLGPCKVTSLDIGFSKFSVNRALLDKTLATMDPSMPFAYDANGDYVTLCDVEVPGKGGKTLCELQNLPTGSKRYPSKYFPYACLREVPNSTRTTAAVREYDGNEVDTSVTDEAATCADPATCARDYPVGGSLDAKDTTGRKSYAALSSIETPAIGQEKMANAVVWGGPDAANFGRNGLTDIMSYPTDEVSKIRKTSAGTWSPVTIYDNGEDNECKKIGFPVVNYCVCAQSQHNDGTCLDPLNEVDVPNEGDENAMLAALNGQLVGGSVLINNAEGPKEFYGKSHFDWVNNILEMIDRVFAWGFSGFGGHAGNQGGKCITYDWGDYRPNYCPGYGPNASNMTVRCTPPGSVEQDCTCENICRVSLAASGTGPPYRDCDAAERISCGSVLGCEHLHRIQDGAPKEYGFNKHPDCQGDIQGEVLLKAELSFQKSKLRKQADAWRIPGTLTNSCAEGGSTGVVQANYEVNDKMNYNYATDLSLGQTNACAFQQNFYKLSRYSLYGTKIPGDPVYGGGSGQNDAALQ